MNAQTGIVKWFNGSKGFGFIMPDSGGKDLFAHVNDVKTSEGTLTENQRVQFDVVQGRKGPQASNIRSV
ncbi:MAG TPA: cold-shock protein [Burkholderiaceae bacterium]|nr:cold-shock protein [Burkholderiaceae bacterium]